MKKYRHTIFAFSLILTLFNVFPLLAVELRFKEGDIFFASLESETDKDLLVSFKNSRYRIPKSDLEFYDISRKGKEESYRVAKVRLRDGSVIKGIFVEENESEIILKTELGFLNLNKSSILAPYPKKEDSPDFPSKYSWKEVELPETRLGISLPIYFFIPALSSNTSALTGLSLYVEPAFVQWGNWSGGFRLDALVGIPSNSLSAYQASFYTFREFWKSESQQHHLNFGFSLGAVNSTYKVPAGSGDTRTGINPLTSLDLMYEYSGWDKYFFRSTFRTQVYMEPKEIIPSLGFELSGGIRL